MPDHLHLAHQLGQIFLQERQPDEIRSPNLSLIAQDLLLNNPKTYGHILALLLDGTPIHQIAKTLKKDKALIRFISRVHPEIRQALQSHTIANLEESLHTFANRLANEANDIPTRDIPKAIATTTEQLALLTGHATSRIEINNVPSREKLQQLYNSFHNKDQSP